MKTLANNKGIVEVVASLAIIATIVTVGVANFFTNI